MRKPNVCDSDLTEYKHSVYNSDLYRYIISVECIVLNRKLLFFLSVFILHGLSSIGVVAS